MSGPVSLGKGGRSFRATADSLKPGGPLLRVEEDRPWVNEVRFAKVVVPSDWGKDSPSLKQHLAAMQAKVIDNMAKMGYEYEGGPFVYIGPFSRIVRYVPRGFIVERNNLDIADTGLDPGRIEYAYRETADGLVWRPKAGPNVTYVMAARYRTRGVRVERLIKETS